MKLMRPPHRRSDAEIDRDLRDLFANANPPRARPGFDVRLARAVSDAAAAERRVRSLRTFLRYYWLGAAAASLGILWHLQGRLTSGPGLWISVAGVLTLLGAGLTFSLLGALPARIGRRPRPLAR